MSQDIVSDGLNIIMNAKKARKAKIILSRHSKLLIRLLDLMKEKGYLTYETDADKIKIEITGLNECKAIKPRYTVDKKAVDKYVRRFLPSRNFGYVIISTNKGLMTHQEAQESKIGGSLIAYFY